jgi:hypothetical protein
MTDILDVMADKFRGGASAHGDDRGAGIQRGPGPHLAEEPLPTGPISNLLCGAKRGWAAADGYSQTHDEGMHMTSMTRQYSSAASHARNAVDKTVDVWTDGARTVADQFPRLPQIDLVPAVERYFDLVQLTVDINRRLAVRWAEAAGTMSGVAREKAGAAGDVMREKAEEAGGIAREQALKAEQAEMQLARQASQAELKQALKAERAARERAGKAEQAENQMARQASQAGRKRARQAHERARQRYEGLPKAELSDLLAKRDLPKRGNINELIERLVEADSR